jgi:Fuc2NAc and GlcNAc transferase
MSTLIIGSLFIISFLLTFFVKEIVRKKGFLDKPNNRSAHKIPTPTLGGIAIVLSFLLGICTMFYAATIPNDLFIPIILGGGLLAIISLFDDIQPIAVKYRITLHILVAVLTVYWLNPNLFFEWFDYHLGFGYFSAILSVIIIIIAINTVNFMDGIDGLVSLEVIFVASTITLLLMQQNNIVEARYFALLVAIMLGFLFWNFSPAKIFMGDVGSIFLGFLLAVLMIVTINNKDISMWTWLILLAVFWVDVVFVLIVRLLTKQKIFKAHKTHCYQKVTQFFEMKKNRTFAHRTTVVLITLINILWLFPLAIVSQYYENYGLWLLIISCLPLLFLAFRFKAGRV